MARFLHAVYSFCIRKWDKFLLAFCWVAGLGFGGSGFRYAGSIFVSQMPLAVVSQPSIFGLLISSALPFLFSAFAVYIQLPWLMYGICFLKASSAAYVSCGVFAVFGASGWLVRWLFLFTDIIGTALLYSYCHRHISGVRKFSISCLAAYAGALFLLISADYSFVSQLLLRVIS